MAQIWLNKEGAKLYPHLVNEWLNVYGYDAQIQSFLIWDNICNVWRKIHITFCEGE